MAMICARSFYISTSLFSIHQTFLTKKKACRNFFSKKKKHRIATTQGEQYIRSEGLVGLGVN